MIKTFFVTTENSKEKIIKKVKIHFQKTIQAQHKEGNPEHVYEELQ